MEPLYRDHENAIVIMIPAETCLTTRIRCIASSLLCSEWFLMWAASASGEACNLWLVPLAHATLATALIAICIALIWHKHMFVDAVAWSATNSPPILALLYSLNFAGCDAELRTFIGAWLVVNILTNAAALRHSVAYDDVRRNGVSVEELV